MGVGENQAFSGQPVQVGRGDSAVAVEDGDISITHVIGEDDQDVRPERLTRRRRNAFLTDDWYQHEPAGQSEQCPSHGTLRTVAIRLQSNRLS